MIQPEASKIDLFNVADYSWNGGAYDPQASWQASLTELAGGNAQARAALAALIELAARGRIEISVSGLDTRARSSRATRPAAFPR
uniref:beta-N-acetylglucosaminidase domain-containing protein n=1 Tax=Rathayibacter soli TaxID=3144168 RepID=UPI0039081940